MVAALNHPGKHPFIDVQDAAAHTKFRPASHNIGGKNDGISTNKSGVVFYRESPATKGFRQSESNQKRTGKTCAGD